MAVSERTPHGYYADANGVGVIDNIVGFMGDFR